MVYDTLNPEIRTWSIEVFDPSTIQCNPYAILESFSNLQIESEQLAKGYEELKEETCNLVPIQYNPKSPRNPDAIPESKPNPRTYGRGI